MNVCEALAKFIAQTKYEDLPESVVSLAKERILDTVGAMIAGYANWGYSGQFLEACRSLETGDYKAIGSIKNEFSIARVAMINSTFAHSVELDDGHKNAGCHAGAVVVPTALAIAQKLGINGKELILAVVLGYEITYRIASNMNPAQINKGFHPTSNCGVFGAMAVAGKILRLSEKQIANGLGHAGMLACGTMEATISGQSSKCIQVGIAAYNGVQAATFAMNDIEGCITALEGKYGLFTLQSNNVNVSDIYKNLGDTYVIGDTYNKMYPTCRHAQPGIEAVIDLTKKYNILPNDVLKIWIGTHEIAYNLTGIIQAPKDSGEAKFSLAYGAAIALTKRSFGICHLTSEYYQDEDILEIARKVVCEIDGDIQTEFPKRRGAKVIIELKDGQKFEKVLFDLKGSPGNPVDWEELEEKFLTNSVGAFTELQIEQLIESIKNIEDNNNISGFSVLLA